MTTEQKELLIEKMIDRPETLSAEEINQILADEELKDMYNLSVKMADELAPIPAVDIDTEWAKLQCSIAAEKCRKQPALRWIGIAAAVAGITIFGGLAIKFASTNNTLPTPDNDIAHIEQPVLKTVPEVKNTIEEIPVQSKPASKTDVQYSNHQKAKLPAEKHSDELDIEEFMRIEQARIDNEVAMARSEAYIAEYETYIEVMVEMLRSNQLEEIDPEQLQINTIEINRLTMI